MFHLIDGPTFRFHLRCAVYIVLGAALATFAGAVAVSMERVHQLEEAQRGSDSEARLLQQVMDRKLNEVEARRESDITDFEGRLREIVSERAGDAGAAKAQGPSPFAVNSVLPSIVELVCIDNVNRETYYTGSGTVIDPSGLIITNHHLLVSGDESVIRYCGVGFTRDLHVPPKIEYVARVVAMHEPSDLALLRITEQIDGKPLPKAFAAISLAPARDTSLALQLGDQIYIGGYPGIGADTFTFTQGVVSGRVGDDLIKTSALIDSGSSGGAAFDAAGGYVGVPTAAVRGEIGGSLGYIIGANAIDDFLKAYADGKYAVDPQNAP